ncbi:uncharacterized protein M421DRAFT_60455 [Didymella exigua CBS 183.55]|uniref:DUF7703 domain-containing protein n=1 Tax=Didymella exigua CBS 183.55 TaxID=1150837 RepID=A0A6A5RNA9_9PLEO|nr:uncharacterized protein M421DRAFT_60455 [Didymella exigua CBS 183.55]KAF1929895.1 hypothetical protein M421DRAFT_60455 [Didymella exigua CBS 183.55]
MMSALPSRTASALTEESTPAQGALLSAGAGITGGYTGNSLSLKIITSVLLGLSSYNAVELVILVLVTFQRYHGLYFWSLLIAGFGVLPYSLGFVIKFFQLLDPNSDAGYVAVVLLTVGWWAMVSGQSVVLWSRLHLLTNSRKVLRWTLYMIIINGGLLHSTTTVLTFASNSNNLSETVLQRYVNGYSIMEKIQMTGFFVQECILSIIYIRETIRLLRLSESVKDDIGSFDDGTGQLRKASVRKTMYQILTINVIIIVMDVALLATEFANLYLIETTLKGVVYSIKLKLEFAVLSKLVQIVQVRTSSKTNSPMGATASDDRRGTGLTLEMTKSGDAGLGTSSGSTRTGHVPSNPHGRLSITGADMRNYPDFVDPRRLTGDFTHARADVLFRNGGLDDWEHSTEEERERWRKRPRGGKPRGSWIDEEMDKHNIG